MGGYWYRSDRRHSYTEVDISQIYSDVQAAIDNNPVRQVLKDEPIFEKEEGTPSAETKVATADTTRNYTAEIEAVELETYKSQREAQEALDALTYYNQESAKALAGFDVAYLQALRSMGIPEQSSEQSSAQAGFDYLQQEQESRYVKRTLRFFALLYCALCLYSKPQRSLSENVTLAMFVFCLLLHFLP